MGRSISDGMSYRNYYMCSGEATSIDNTKIYGSNAPDLPVCYIDIPQTRDLGSGLRMRYTHRPMETTQNISPNISLDVNYCWGKSLLRQTNTIANVV